jgi:transcriptional regulator with XRE-family HTH domain
MRTNQRFTQKQLAAALKVPQSFISKLESGERRTDLIELIAILDVLGVSVEKFLQKLSSERR